MTLCITSFCVVLRLLDFLSLRLLFHSLLLNIFHSITAICLKLLFDSQLHPADPDDFALLPHYTGSPAQHPFLLNHSQNVLSRRRKILGVPMSLSQAQRRYVCCIWAARARNPGEDDLGWIRLREALWL
ncbi:hypothetical protein ONS95_003225 [Cadophora gregata]|uniref:uncharacterized protein n=1 Tax=Cadophora gregata TaxID=51156 RepID=UPI0026DBA4AB|nr:uncharacterized protein ONS95_003225 [Cadophora gregata]KAK0108417.1 hypothetical protein ONS95_003225 [Cadophora gregata]